MARGRGDLERMVVEEEKMTSVNYTPRTSCGSRYCTCFTNFLYHFNEIVADHDLEEVMHATWWQNGLFVGPSSSESGIPQSICLRFLSGDALKSH